MTLVDVMRQPTVNLAVLEDVYTQLEQPEPEGVKEAPFQFAQPWSAEDPWANSNAIVRSWNDRELTASATAAQQADTPYGQAVTPYPLTGQPTKTRRFGILQLGARSSHDILNEWGFNLRDMMDTAHDRHQDDVVAGLANGLLAVFPEWDMDEAVLCASELADLLQQHKNGGTTPLEGMGFIGSQEIDDMPRKGTMRRLILDGVRKVVRPLEKLQVWAGELQARFMDMKPGYRYAAAALGATAAAGLVGYGENQLLPDTAVLDDLMQGLVQHD
jgi:hypothetical protein